MRMPEVRQAMLDMAKRLRMKGEAAEAAALAKLADETRRRSPVHRARRTARTISPAVISDVWACFHANPDWSFRRIGQHVNVDGGRVSEILAGKRT